MKNNNENGRKTRRKGVVLGVSITALIAVALAVGITLSYLFTQTDEKVNVFKPGNVQCEVVEVYNDNVKSSITVKNTGNTEAYMRVCFTTYYENASGAKIGESATIPDFDLGEDWVKGSDGFYYYKVPVAPGASTTDLTGTDIVLQSKEDIDGAPLYQVIEVFAEAIQAMPNDAVLDSWESVAMIADDNTLMIDVKQFSSYANAYGYRIAKTYTNSVNSVSSDDGWSAYHNGNVNDGKPATYDVIGTSAENTDEYKFKRVIHYHLVDTVDVSEFSVYTDSNNLKSIEVYAGTNEYTPDNASNGAVIKVGNMQRIGTTSRYYLKVGVPASASYVSFVFNLSSNATLNVYEADVSGFLKQKNIALSAQYKGGDGTTVIQKNNSHTADVNSWNSYHTGELNDKGRSSTSWNNDPAEKVIVTNTTQSNTSMKLYFKLAAPSIVNKVDLFSGGLNIYNGSANESNWLRAEYNNQISAINVYVGTTEENATLWASNTSPTAIQTKPKMVTDTVESAEGAYGQYVIIELVGAANKMTFGLHEIYIWTNSVLEQQ